MVGSSLFRELSSKGYYNLIGKTSKELDLRNQKSVNNFFEKVMVNADDSKIKNNRYSLLFKLRQNLNCVADISKLAS